MREGAQSPLSDISDMDDNPLERARSGDEEGEQAERHATEHGEVHAGRRREARAHEGASRSALGSNSATSAWRACDNTSQDTGHDIR